VNEKQSVYINSQFRLAASRCRHEQFNSFVTSGADASSQSPGLLFLMSPAPSIVEATPCNSNEAVKHASAKPGVQSVSVTFSLSKLAADSSCRQAGNLDAVRDAWCRDVASITRAALVEIMGVTCLTRDCPSSALLSHITGRRSDMSVVLAEAATQDRGIDLAEKRSESGDVQDSDVAVVLESTTGSHERFVTKRVLSCDSPTAVSSDDTALKRHKANNCLASNDVNFVVDVPLFPEEVQHVNDNCSVMYMSSGCESSDNNRVVDDNKPLDAAGENQLFRADGLSQSCAAGSRNFDGYLRDVECLFAADCSASCRLWSGRKKVRQQLMHFNHEYLRELEVTKVLKSMLPESASTTQSPVLAFEIVVFRRPVVAVDTVTIAMCPTRNTFAEFSCFAMYFKSLLIKLVERCVTGASSIR
jgi:hypothetical protein